MEKPLMLHLDDKPLRFTPDGKVSVVDAIGATTLSNRAHAIWEGLKEKHPEILPYCEDYSFQENDLISVVNSEGWEIIMMLLPYYVSIND
jgi:hypothetical protein